MSDEKLLKIGTRVIVIDDYLVEYPLNLIGEVVSVNPENTYCYIVDFGTSAPKDSFTRTLKVSASHTRPLLGILEGTIARLTVKSLKAILDDFFAYREVVLFDDTTGTSYTIKGFNVVDEPVRIIFSSNQGE